MSIEKNTPWTFLHTYNIGVRSHDFKFIQYHYFTYVRSKFEKWYLDNGILLLL